VKPLTAIALICIALAAFVLDCYSSGYSKQYPPEVPTVNIPLELRQSNWYRGSRSNGSCTWASVISLLRWQEEYKYASRIQKARGGGVPLSDFAKQLDSTGMHYAKTSSGNVAFLNWALRTRRGAAVGVCNGRHMVCLVHLDGQRAGVLDNNDIRSFKWYPRKAFLREWKKAGGWAFVPVGSPVAPLP